mmetsp:Transcript_4504/g.10438  ORF Transcript_4504/g.10438 Transcript_4504/m.10438 type:complete len:235 (+) Transcript_4504:350-1054(+)
MLFGCRGRHRLVTEVAAALLLRTLLHVLILPPSVPPAVLSDPVFLSVVRLTPPYQLHRVAAELLVRPPLVHTMAIRLKIAKDREPCPNSPVCHYGALDGSLAHEKGRRRRIGDARHLSVPYELSFVRLNSIGRAAKVHVATRVRGFVFAEAGAEGFTDRRSTLAARVWGAALGHHTVPQNGVVGRVGMATIAAERGFPAVDNALSGEISGVSIAKLANLFLPRPDGRKRPTAPA